MNRTVVFALATFALLTFLLSTAGALELCLKASQSEPSAVAPCSYVDVTTSSGPYVAARCANSGTPNIYWNLTLPQDLPDAMVFTGFEVYWGKGLATTGNGCWHTQFQVFKDGQDFTEAVYPTAWALAGTAIPTTTLVKLSNSVATGDGTIKDQVDADCSAAPGACRGAPFRVRLFRFNTSCTSNADNDIDFLKLCFTY